jgi:hypothetical protein
MRFTLNTIVLAIAAFAATVVVAAPAPNPEPALAYENVSRSNPEEEK